MKSHCGRNFFHMEAHEVMMTCSQSPVTCFLFSNSYKRKKINLEVLTGLKLIYNSTTNLVRNTEFETAYTISLCLNSNNLAGHKLHVMRFKIYDIKMVLHFEITF